MVTDHAKFFNSTRHGMNSAAGKESLLKQTTNARLFPVRFSVLLVLAGGFSPRRMVATCFSRGLQPSANGRYLF
jgi:hypothetical protein